MSDPDLYDVLGLAMGLAIGVASFIASSAYLRHPNVDRGRYWKWLGLLALWCAVAPILYFLTSPSPISLMDAFFLQERHVGWRHPFIAYSALGGVLLAGIARLAMPPR